LIKTSGSSARTLSFDILKNIHAIKAMKKGVERMKVMILSFRENQMKRIKHKRAEEAINRKRDL